MRKAFLPAVFQFALAAVLVVAFAQGAALPPGAAAVVSAATVREASLRTYFAGAS